MTITNQNNSQISFKEQRIRKITELYYSRPEIQRAIFEFSENREVVPRYFEGFGKRPDKIQYPSDILGMVKKGATSFHCSEELWNEPLEISTSMNEKQFDEIRKGWDLLIDIDSKYLDYSKILAQLIIEFLTFHGVKNVGIKFSGSKGFHIIVPWNSFPKKVYQYETKNMFPDWARIISRYITEKTKPKLIQRLTQLTTRNKYILDSDVADQVMPDIILVSPRHLFRMPYSLHEKTALASVVLNSDELQNFQPSDADPLKVKVKNFMPESDKGEARELLMQAMDWYRESQNEVPQESNAQSSYSGKPRGEFKEIELDRSKVEYAPAIEKILEGVKDGKKRALFILLNYFRCINFNLDEIDKIIKEWNDKNEEPLKEGYIRAQLSWHRRQKNKILPPNYSTDFYKGIGIIPTQEEIHSKNPVSYTIRKFLQKKRFENEEGKGKK